MKKLAFVLAILLIIAVPFEVSATTPRSKIAPSLTFNGTTAICEAQVLGDNTTDHLVVTMKLMRGIDCIATWTTEGYGSVSFSRGAAVYEGVTYKLVVTVTANGIAKDPVSVTATCNG